MNYAVLVCTHTTSGYYGWCPYRGYTGLYKGWTPNVGSGKLPWEDRPWKDTVS